MKNEKQTVQNRLEALKELTTTDLLNYLRFSEIVCDYYDNEAKANTGNYDEEATKAFDAASGKFAKYLGIQRLIFNEIERRVDTL